MLVLTRTLRESDVIIDCHGTQIVVSLLAVRDGYKVKIGIEAPPEVTILRREIMDRPQKAPA